MRLNFLSVLSGRYLGIKINSASDNLISIIVKNGKIIDWDGGAYLDSFENNEQYAKNIETKKLNKNTNEN